MYFEGELPTVSYGNCNNGNNGWNDWSWIIGLALVGGLFGNGGFGFGGGFGGGRGYGYDVCCGTPATQADLANGFAQNTIQRGIDDIILGQAQAINYNNQGFAGLNSVINTGFAGVNNAICTLGYQNAQLVNGLSRELAECCCSTGRAIDSVKYENAKNTCDIIRAGQDNTRAILDYLSGEKIASLQAENAGLKAQISNDRQSAFIIDALAPKCPQPAYVVQPPQQVTFATNCCGNTAYAGYGACGTSVQ
jgi:hypothetical protein